jgi:POT family proton-dependent oligopeptide transporter
MTDRKAADAGLPVVTTSQRHPGGLYVLFFTEMWERFSYYGMRAFLVLFMTSLISEGGLGWEDSTAGTAYGWYTALVYLLPIFGGMIADRLFGTHWSMVIGGAVIAAGHFTLAWAGSSDAGLDAFVGGLTLIIIGTGFFKPCVSVMVGQLYDDRDVRRDAAFTIFYMGINLGAFLGPLICGGLRIGYRDMATGAFGWHYAFGAAGVGMVLGLIVYMIGRPFLLRGIGLAPRERTKSVQDWILLIAYIGLPLVGFLLWKYDRFASVNAVYDMIFGSRLKAWISGSILVTLVAGGVSWFISAQDPEDRGPVAAIFVMSFFVIFFWVAFEQAGTSMTLFAERNTDRSLSPEFAQNLSNFASDPHSGVSWIILAGLGIVALAVWAVVRNMAIRADGSSHPLLSIGKVVALSTGSVLVIVAILKVTGGLESLFPKSLLADPQYPAEWFQSVNPMCILLLAPIFALVWVRLGNMKKEPSTPLKFAIGLILLGVGFLFMVFGAHAASQVGPDGSPILVTGFYLLAAYSVHTMGELCLSPVGLSMVTKLAPLRFASLLMGVWFLSNFVANLAGGIIGGRVEQISEKGFIIEGQAGFFLMFVIAPISAGIVMLLLTPIIKRMMQGRA